MSSAFTRYGTRDVLELIAEYPLAWVTAADGDGDHASLLPLMSEVDEEGRLTSLLGHMARINPLYERLSADPRVLILFQGPHGYISGSWMRDRRWVPTWNFAQLRIEGTMRFAPDEGDAALATLVNAMERGRENPWRVEEAGARYGAMERAIIAFHIEVRAVHGRFKLGQDERPEVLAEILARVCDPNLARWMRRFNPGRCGPDGGQRS